MEDELLGLKSQLKGTLNTDALNRSIYSTDASMYQELPLAVVFPKCKEDVVHLIQFANKHRLGLIPRTAGTSLAGQCVGKGIVIDFSKHFNQIIELNVNEKWVRVQPGVVRDELNAFLKPHGLFFGPNTATANRCMIGGMVGNNSSGSTSIKYGTSRDKLLEVNALLSDASEVLFKKKTLEELKTYQRGDALEDRLYQHTLNLLSDPVNQKNLKREYPKPNIHRRNTGYALDVLLHSEAFDPSGDAFNFCKLLAGSEGTLATTLELKLELDPLPPDELVLVCVHFESIKSALEGAVLGMQHEPYACELMDKIILDCTKESRIHSEARFFIQGDPQAIMVFEMRASTEQAVQAQVEQLILDLKSKGLGYAYPIIEADRAPQVWNLRKAGLGLLENIPGSAKAIPVIEDTAVALEDLPDYIAEFDKMMEAYGQKAVHYAHAGAGELHLRPILDLKTEDGLKNLRLIAESSARLVKKYRGSLSGEHGDGRLRAEFIPLMIGAENYALLRELKAVWDPKGIFNPGKIVDAPPMDTQLRYVKKDEESHVDTLFDFSKEGNFLLAAEKCTGSAECRKTHHIGGAMCPSFMATRNEKDSTRGRANALRNFLSKDFKSNVLDSWESTYEIMELCLNCKACASECPSNVDMAKLKTEFLQHYYKEKGTPLKTKLFANISTLFALGAMVPKISNWFIGNKLFSGLLKKSLGIHPNRSLPLLSEKPLRNWFKNDFQSIWTSDLDDAKKVLFFCDEFTNFNDAAIGRKAILLLDRLGYKVEMPKHKPSGRAHFSKGLLRQAKALANENVRIFSASNDSNVPIIGVEPSTILSFRDEYPGLVDSELMSEAKVLAKRTLLFEEFIWQEFEAGRIKSEQFKEDSCSVLVHGHCHQKSLSSVDFIARVLSIPTNYSVENIPSGCCGMAGAFGYEKDKFELSNNIGELVLFPALRKANSDTIIAASGTSCRHQIKDGINRQAMHSAEILFDALK